MATGENNQELYSAINIIKDYCKQWKKCIDLDGNQCVLFRWCRAWEFELNMPPSLWPDPEEEK